MLVHLFATETNPDQLVLRVVSESSLLEEARRLSHSLSGSVPASDVRIMECCILSKIPLELFWERLQLLARILNLIPYDQNYYEILGIEHSASQREIRQAFRRLSFACHPDTNPHDPNAAERFHTLQHAYQVLSHELLRQRYDHNLGEHFWENGENAGSRIVGLAWWGKWRRTWPLGLLIALLVVTTFVFDYSQWQTERYYAEMKTPPASKPVREGNEIAPRATPLPKATLPEPDKPSSSRERSETESQKPVSALSTSAESLEARDEKPAVSAVPVQPDFSSRAGGTVKPAEGKPSETMRDEAQRPTGKVVQATSGTGDERALPKNGQDGAGRDSLIAVTTASPQPSAAAKATPKIPLSASHTETERTPSGKGQESRQQAEVKQVVTTPASSARQREPPPASPAGGTSPDSFVPVENLDHEIRKFLSHYTSTYESRDVGAFMRLFEANAIENGRPIQELVPLYQANFKRAEKLRYRINLGRWEIGEGEVMVDGSFSLAVQFEREAPVGSAGSIQLTLIRRAGGFGVKRLNYTFKESKTIPD